MSQGALARGAIAAVALALIGLAAPPVCAQPPPPAAAASAALIAGVYPDGTRWGMQKPANWNGTLIVDLDGAPPVTLTGRANPFNAWLLSKGYAVGGITREPVGYDFPKAVDYLLTVRQAAIDTWGPARRTLVVGNSRGAFAARKALELRPEIFDGGFISAGGGGGEIAVLRNKLNSLFVLKTLLDPNSPMKLVNIDPAVENPALNALVAKARTTPQGRARLAFSAAMQQFAPWSSRNAPKPAVDDYEAQLDQIADNFGFGTALSVRAGVEKIAGGNVSWNTDADYGALLRRSGRQAMVEALYKKAGLDLQADLALLRRTPHAADLGRPAGGAPRRAADDLQRQDRRSRGQCGQRRSRRSRRRQAGLQAHPGKGRDRRPLSVAVGRRLRAWRPDGSGQGGRLRSADRTHRHGPLGRYGSAGLA